MGRLSPGSLRSGLTVGLPIALLVAASLAPPREAAFTDLAGNQLNSFSANGDFYTVEVNSTGNGTDASPGDGLCDTGGTNSAGDPECTLRAAIAEANASTINTIHFDLPATEPGHSGGTWAIDVTGSALPPVTPAATIDATTQTGWASSPIVVLDGSSGPVGIDGLHLQDSGSTVRGLSIVSFADDGVNADGTGGHTIVGNYIGLLPDGTTGAGNGGNGINASEPNNTIGGPTAADRNVISGNGADGIRIGQTGNTVEGNYIGTDATGLVDRGNSVHGIDLENDTATILDNVISGNSGTAIVLDGSVGTTIRGNRLGVGADDATPIANDGDGIQLNGIAAGNIVGGVATEDGNLILNNGDEGISVDPTASGNSFLGNRIGANGALGIDLDDNNAVTPNDAGDADSGGNDLLNFPVITSATDGGLSLDVEIDLDVPAGDYRIEFFSSPSGADPSGHGEGELLLHGETITHTGSGVEAFSFTFAGSAGQVLSATTTEDLGASAFGSTSEFSAAVTAVMTCDDPDGDGLCTFYEVVFGDTDGDTTVNYLDADDDGDGVPTSAESPDPNADGDPRDALDADHDGQADWLDAPTDWARGWVATVQKVSDTTGGLVAPLVDDDAFGVSVAPVGDLDGDGIVDIAVGAFRDDDGGTDRGAVYVLFLNADGTVKGEQKISDTQGGLTTPLGDGDLFGVAVAGLGDIDGDGVNDLAVGASLDGDGGSFRGAVYVLFLNADGTVKGEQKISDTQGGLTTPLGDGDQFGDAVTSLGDLDGDGIGDLAVGVQFDDDGGSNRGAVYVLFLNADGTVKGEQKISDTQGGLSTVLGDNDRFGSDVAALGDVDDDGIGDLAAGAWFDDDGGTNRGAVYVLFLNADGTVKGEQKISDTQGGFGSGLADFDFFGYSVAGPGDIDGDGTPDLVVGATGDNDSNAGAAYVVFLDTDGTVLADSKVSETSGNLGVDLDSGDNFGAALAGLGDLDGDGTIGLAIAAVDDDDGGSQRGSIYVIDLAPPLVAVVNSSGDASDLVAGDDVCDTGGLNSEGAPECTLRAAIEEANASAEVDLIHFALPTSDSGHSAGLWTIVAGIGLSGNNRRCRDRCPDTNRLDAGPDCRARRVGAGVRRRVRPGWIQDPPCEASSFVDTPDDGFTLDWVGWTHRRRQLDRSGGRRHDHLRLVSATMASDIRHVRFDRQHDRGTRTRPGSKRCRRQRWGGDPGQ